MLRAWWRRLSEEANALLDELADGQVGGTLLKTAKTADTNACRRFDVDTLLVSPIAAVALRSALAAISGLDALPRLCAAVAAGTETDLGALRPAGHRENRP
jgi:hypothetical protein